MDKLFIIDVMGYIFRSYHAIRQMTNAKGESTNALFGFIRSVQKLINDFDAKNVVAVFDGPENEKSRKTIYAQYKANRGETPKDLIDQFNWVEEYCALKGIPMLSVSGVEADDTMASIALWAEKQGTKVYLCSTDKDLCQIVDGNIHVLNTFKDNLIVTPTAVEEKYGVPPRLIGDWLAIVGDASDNVPGVPGIGPKGATDLLTQFGSLEKVLENASNIKGKKGQTLADNKQLALLSRQLVELDIEVDFPKDADFYSLKKEKTNELKSFFQDKNFTTMVSDLGGSKEVDVVEYRLVNDIETFNELLETLQKHSLICVDTETTSEDPMKAELVGIGFGVKEKQAWYIPLNGALDPSLIKEKLKPILADPEKSYLGHNIKYDLHVLRRANLPVNKVGFDTMVASYLLHADERQHSLDRISVKRLDKVKIPIEELIGKGKNQITMREVPIEKVFPYCAEDVDYTFRLMTLFKEDLKTRKLESLFYDIEIPLIAVLERMEAIGVYIDQKILKDLSANVGSELEALTKEIFTHADEAFNINSPKQLGVILFDKLGITPPKKTKTGYSTSADVLESLKHVHPIISLVLQYRSLEKLRSTYLDSLPLQVNPETGRIHCTFNQSVAATGRLSSQNPNLQNIPVRTPLGKEIRAAFCPKEEGWSYLSCDYSQIELRLLAHFSKDPNLVEAFQKGADIHRATASLVFEVMEPLVTDTMRYQAKAVNFGIIYGQQAWGLSQELDISQKQAKQFIERYFETYPGVKKYVERCIEEAKKTGVATTIMGRERPIPEVDNKNPVIRSLAERLAVNTPLQGSNADLIKMAMLNIDKFLYNNGFKAKMILQIHDELLFEVPDEEIDQIIPLVKKEMEGIYELNVPLIVDIGIGKNWKEC